MKHLINILGLLIITGLSVGTAYMTRTSPSINNCWGFLFVPITGFYLSWGVKLYKDYKKNDN